MFIVILEEADECQSKAKKELDSAFLYSLYTIEVYAYDVRTFYCI